MKLFVQVGESTIKISSLCVNNGIDEWFPIQHKGKQSGQVHLKSVWKPMAGGAAKAGAASMPQGMAMGGMMQQPMMMQQPYVMGGMQPGMMQQPMMMQPGMM